MDKIIENKDISAFQEVSNISKDHLERFKNLISEMAILYGELTDESKAKSNQKPSQSDKLKDVAHPINETFIKKQLNKDIIENVFREFAQKIKADDGIIITKNEIRKGSLKMNLINGGWHRFSNGDSGDIIKFISIAEKIPREEAVEILRTKVGTQVDEKELSDNNEDVGGTVKGSDKVAKAGKDDWVACEYAPSDAKQFTPDKHLGYWLKSTKNKVTNIYEYRDTEKRLIGYAVRVVCTKIDSETKESREVKQVMPVAYCKNEAKGKSTWKLKGLLVDGFKPIYRAEELNNNPSRPVLIVEGEKTADASSSLFPEFCTISWLGGSQVIDRVNWEVIKNREIIIWPDADEPGIKAANAIKDKILELNDNASANLVKIVDIDSLQLPEKWDLADDLPSHLTLDQVEDLLREILSEGEKL